MDHEILLKNARELRKNMTEMEKCLWKELRRKNLKHRFNRQIILEERYIVDFYCAAKALVIELDGGQHNENKKDETRDNYLKERGYKILRFWNNEIAENMEGCLWKIREITEN